MTSDSTRILQSSNCRKMKYKVHRQSDEDDLDRLFDQLSLIPLKLAATMQVAGRCEYPRLVKMNIVAGDVIMVLR